MKDDSRRNPEIGQFYGRSQRKKSAVLVDMAIWEQIVTLLEDAEDAEAIKQARAIREEQVPWRVAKKKELKPGK